LRASPEDRFWDNVFVTESCWLWLGAKDTYGYGQFSVGGRLVLVHKWAYVRWRGSVPLGKELDHLCRVRRCVNPTHLQAVSHRLNMSRGYWARKTYCPKGHPYDARNTFFQANGQRTCRECKAQWQRNRAARLKESKT
jgi:hypothetical protein